MSFFRNQPGDNPFMAGAIMHGLGEAEAIINTGVGGPDVVARALERKIKEFGGKQIGLHDMTKALNLPLGVVDLYLAITPKVGDSIGEIMKIR